MFKKREIENKILQNIDNNKVILILWARQVWKTTILKKIKDDIEKQWKETFYFNLEKYLHKDFFNKDPENILELVWNNKNIKYVFIDEIQLLDNPSNFLKLLYDEHKDHIKLIVTWSSAFYIDKKFKDSLAGRNKIFYMYSLNFREFLIFKKKDKLLNELCKKETWLYYKHDIIKLYKEYITYWGYPDVVLANSISEKIEILSDIANTYLKKDIFEANIKYEEKYFFILKILASQIWNLLNVNEISNTVNLPSTTVEKYIYVMRKSFHIATIKPFFEKNIRKELTKMTKVYFFDIWLRNYFINNFEPLDFRIDIWSVLENLVYINLIINTSFDEIKFWRTQNKNEVDFVIEREKKAYEVKTNLKKFDEKKYKLFKNTYDNFTLEAIDLEKSLELL
jgi:uncharacterized protein